MKNLKFFSLLILGLVLFASCEENEETDPTISDCPELSFIQEGKELLANFEELNTLEVYEWFVNDELIETEALQNQRDNKLDLKTYTPGTYTVCIKAETPDCPNGAEFCMEVVIEDETNESCPDLNFTRDGAYLFANFEGIDTLEFYAWQITGGALDNESIIENEGVSFQGDNKYSLKDLQSGTYTICLISESPTCVQAEPFCKEIVIEESGNNGNNGDNEGDSNTDNGEEDEIDCSKDAILAVSSDVRVVVSLISLPADVDKFTSVWSIDGVVTNSNSSINNYMDFTELGLIAGTYEVCYEFSSQACGALKTCTTINFPGQ